MTITRMSCRLRATRELVRCVSVCYFLFGVMYVCVSLLSMMVRELLLTSKFTAGRGREFRPTTKKTMEKAQVKAGTRIAYPYIAISITIPNSNPNTNPYPILTQS